jgi:hypothetical protein
MDIVKTRFTEGVWEGLLSGSAEAPRLALRHAGRDLPPPKVVKAAEGDDAWAVFVDLPASVMGDGVQTVTIVDEASGETLDAIHVLAGEALDDDLRAEVQLLREELDMLKRAFRRHCVETA